VCIRRASVDHGLFISLVCVCVCVCVCGVCVCV